MHEGPDDKTLRKYLLGDLPDAQRLELEELLVQDEHLFERLGPVEDELIEEYVEGSLHDAECWRFESHFLALPQVPQHLALVRRLKQRGARERRGRGKPVHTASSSWRAWTAVAAVMVLAAGNLWLIVGATKSARQMEQLRTEAQASDAERRRTSQRQDELTAMVETLRRQVEAAAGSVAPTFVLAARLLRSEGSLTRITVPKEARTIRLRLELATDRYPDYRVAIHDPDGDEIWAQSKLRAETGTPRKQIVIVLPVEVLTRGDYVVRVSGALPSKAPEPVAAFAFRVALP